MKLILKQHLSGADGVLEIGDTIDISDEQAVAYIEKGIATPKTKKELDSFLGKVEEIKAKKLEDKAKVKAILEQGAIQNELNKLYLAVVLKEAELNGEVLSDEEILKAVESIQKRDSLVSNETGSN